MRKLAITAVILLGLAAPARADVGIGVFVGQPTGLDIKIGLQGRSALDIVLGTTRLDEPRASYGHLTYLILLGMARGQSVNVPIRLGIGAAVYGFSDDNTQLAARMPFQLGLRFRRTPLEIYGEIALVIELIDDLDTDVDGGIGLRVYF